MKKLKLTKVIASTLVVASILALNPIGASAEWRQDSIGWWYTEGSSWATGWREIGGKWYYFHYNGYMAKNTTVDGYKLGSDGAWISEPPATINQLPINMKIKKPDSIGTVYIEATYTNNSNLNITGYSITVLLKDSNEKTYLLCYDTVRPGETSSKFTSFGPKTLNKDDIEMLEYNINIANADGTTTYVTYDCKLKQYKWF